MLVAKKLHPALHSLSLGLVIQKTMGRGEIFLGVQIT